MQIIHADIVYSEDREHLASHPDSYIAVENGRVKGIWAVLPEEYAHIPVTDYKTGVLIPAFSDLHVHAPQYLNRGLEMDLLLADWLDKCTFPMEARYADTEFAKLAYDAFVDDTLLLKGNKSSKTTPIFIKFDKKNHIPGFHAVKCAYILLIRFPKIRTGSDRLNRSGWDRSRFVRRSSY